MRFIRRVFYRKGNGTVLMWHSSDSDTFPHTTVEQDFGIYPELSEYRENREALGYMEWEEADEQIEQSFVSAYGVAVDVSKQPPELVFDYTPGEFEPNEVDEALDLLEGRIRG